MSHTITSDQLRKLCPALAEIKAKEIASRINEVAPRYEIDTRLRMAAFVSQMAHESSDFKSKSEGMNYAEEGLKSTFSYYKAHPALAKIHGRNAAHPADQEAIANTVYDDANRDASRKLGNVFPGDGWIFRGAAYGQLTGRGIITRFARYKSIDVKSAADYMRTTELWAVEGFAWFFSIEAKLLDEADKGDITAISKRVAGSTIGLQERKDYYNKALSIFK